MSIQQLFFGGETSPYLMTATGGTITYDGKFAVHTFSASGTFTVTYKSTSGLTYQTLLVGFGADGSYGDFTDFTNTAGGNGGPGGSGGNVKSYASLPVDTGSSSAAVTIGPNYSSGASILNWNATYLYTSNDAGNSYAVGGAGGVGEHLSPSTAATAGANNVAGFSSSITGSAVIYASSGAGGGGGGYSNRTGTGAAGGTGTNGAGNGGAGGSTATPDGFSAGTPTSGYGVGGSGGGGAYSDESGSYSGGPGTNGRAGVTIIRYQYLP